MSDSLSEWWFALQAWWQQLTPDSQVFVRAVAVILGAFLAGGDEAITELDRAQETTVRLHIGGGRSAASAGNVPSHGVDGFHLTAVALGRADLVQMVEDEKIKAILLFLPPRAQPDLRNR